MTRAHVRDFAEQTALRLSLAMGLTLAFVVLEAAGGFVGHSLALLTDAAHNFSDVLALGLSAYAVRLASRTANSRNTYGYHRAGILVALVNSTTLALISLGVFYEAYRRFLSRPPVQGGLVIGVGLIAFVVNLGTAWLLRHHDPHDLNLRSTFLHLVADVVSTLGAVLAGVLIYFTHANWLDPLASVLIGALILWNAWGILRETVDILLESTPRDVDMVAMVNDMLQTQGVLGVHDLHVWSITQGMRSMSAHILAADTAISTGAAIQSRLNELLVSRYHITHATLQLECAGCEPDLLYCDLVEVGPGQERSLPA